MALRLLHLNPVVPNTGLEVRFWGVRGSIAAGGQDFAEVGGNTSCVEVRAGDELIILDAGTGLFRLSETLPEPVRATFLISHYHWDHIQGFPLFRPAYHPDNRFDVYGPGGSAATVTRAFDEQMRPPHFPVGLSAMAAQLTFHGVQAGDELTLGAVRVTAAALNHPHGCLGYRISHGDVSVVYATDTEHAEFGALDAAVLELARDADLLIYDAQYTDDEYLGVDGPCRKGWGHSTATAACRMARAAGVRQLALFHHDPAHRDDRISEIVRDARAVFGNTVAAREAMRIVVERPEWAAAGECPGGFNSHAGRGSSAVKDDRERRPGRLAHGQPGQQAAATHRH